MVAVERTSVPFKTYFHFFHSIVIPFATTKWGNECLGTIDRGSKQAGGEIRKTNTKERWEGTGNREGERRRF